MVADFRHELGLNSRRDPADRLAVDRAGDDRCVGVM
jgi:hypothetical protein